MLLAIAGAVLASMLIAAPSWAAQSYCAPSGDFCTSVSKVDGVRIIGMRTFSLRGRIRVCIGAEWGFDCKPFRLRQTSPESQVRSVRVRWRRHFPDQGPGLYRVSFDQHGERVGPTLSFRR